MTLKRALLPALILFAAFGADSIAQERAPDRAQERVQGRERENSETPKGLIRNDPGAWPGCTLFAPLGSTKTYLIDEAGKIVNSWESDCRPGNAVYLLENGHLLRTGSMGRGNETFRAGGSGGRIQEFTWDGEIVWDFTYSSEDHLLHHDIEKMPNGNVLMLAWERKTAREALDAGRNPQRLSKEEGLWPDTIIEVEQTGKTTGKIVWEWHVWDHLIQDIRQEKANYGTIADHPELININPKDWEDQLSNEERARLEALGYLGGRKQTNRNDTSPDWNHINSIDYNAALDQIMVSVLGFNEIWIIDHGTTTEEAAGHKGGRCGKGGDLLYRWGNPQVWRGGDAEDQKLFAQHDARWIPEGCPGAGNILIFNNGRGRPDGSYSSVDEIVPPVNRKGHYTRKKSAPFGPAAPTWSYTAPEKADFFSSHISGAQRLPNGNTLICSGEKGRFFEVTKEKTIVWEYVNPVVEMARFGQGGPGMPPPFPGMGERDNSRRGQDRRGQDGRGQDGPGRDVRDEDGRGQDGPGRDGPGRDGRRRFPGGRPGGGPGGRGPKSSVFRANRYGLDFPGLAGKELVPGKTIEETLPARSPLNIPGRDRERPASAPSVDPDRGPFVIKDFPVFTTIVGPGETVEKLADGMQFTEGPVWIDARDCLLFSDIPADTIMKWQDGNLAPFRRPSRQTNGNLLDREGRLLSCEHGSRSLTRTGRDGTVETLVSAYEGKKFNSPNDLAVRADGTIWFTDPPYGLKQRKRELEKNNVFRFDPATSELVVVADDFDRPNGICFSPDGSRLYIADSGKPRHIRVFDVDEDGSLAKGRVFCTIDEGAPDGIRCDEKGRLFASAGDGVQIFHPDGHLVGKILVPLRPANLCFGGEDGKTLFITARTSLYSIRLLTGGSFPGRGAR